MFWSPASGSIAHAVGANSVEDRTHQFELVHVKSREHGGVTVVTIRRKAGRIPSLDSVVVNMAAKQPKICLCRIPFVYTLVAN